MTERLLIRRKVISSRTLTLAFLLAFQDGEWDDEDDGKPSNQRSGEMAFLSDLLGPGGVEDLMADDMDLFNAPEDPELKDDPIWSMDMKVSSSRSCFDDVTLDLFFP